MKHVKGTSYVDLQTWLNDKETDEADTEGMGLNDGRLHDKYFRKCGDRLKIDRIKA
jgi:hypothetical protein